MLIQCTKKLLDKLNIKSVSHIDEEPLFSWHANLITINRRKAIVIVNDKNRYVIVLYGLKAKDFKKLDEIIIDSICDTFKSEGIKSEIIEQFINHSKEIVYTKTKNRSLIAKMNSACEVVGYYDQLLNNDFINQSVVSMRANHYYIKVEKNKYIHANESMYEDLAAFAGNQIFRCKAVELKVTLDLGKHKVWREIIVPYNITFRKLHNIMQTTFRWKDYHLHEFYIFDGNNPVVNIVYDEDSFEYSNGLPMKLETDIKLSDYIPKYRRIKYNYDFGDNWEHYIEVERVIDDYSKNYPVCLCGEGNTPPEDVGGKYGYEEFLEIISDVNHPEHESMLEWGKSQYYKDFDIELVNRLLKHLLR